MGNWSHAKRLARKLRAEVDTLEGCCLSGEQLVEATARMSQLTLVPLPPDDPLLRGARSLLDETAAVIAVNDDLPKEAKAFSIAHEIGHLSLHGGACLCSAADVDEAPTTTSLPYAEGYIESYNPRQRRETEANMFAAEFLMPSNETRRLFVDDEMSCSRIAAHFGVSETAMLNQMATVLLNPGAASELDTATDEQLLPLPDDTQARASKVPHGPALIDAGPGTGKTLTLVHRVLHLLQDRKATPESILALTFSNRAASEMHIRLAGVAPEQVQAVTICTFHAFCLDILRRYAPQAGLPTDLRVLDPVDAAMLLERNLEDLDLVEYLNLAAPNLYLGAILRAISRAKDELVGPDEYARLGEKMLKEASEDEARMKTALRVSEVAHAYRHYQNLLTAEGLVDFGDLVALAVSLLQGNPNILDELRRQYHHVLVDEYQDVNRASAILLKLLVRDGRGLWAVGDLRQAIYRFRGASPVNIGAFEEDYPGGTRLSLDVNYRSSPRLVDLYNHVARQMPLDDLPIPNWQSSRESENIVPVTLTTATDSQAEVSGIAEAIEARKSEGWCYNQQAVLCRTNAQAAAIAAGLGERGTPVCYLGNLFERPEIKDMLALLSLACEGDGTALVRVAQIADHSIASQDVQSILGHARATGRKFPDVLENASEVDGVSSEGVRVASSLAELLMPQMYKSDAWGFFAHYLFESSSYARSLLRSTTVASQQSLLALSQLLALARGFGSLPLADSGGHGKRAFLDYVRRLVTSQDSRIYQPLSAECLDAVRILTIHASKGLEFPIVYLTNLAQRRFPPQKPWDPAPPPPGLTQDIHDDESVEEACLFFVAISRARDALVLSRSERYGKRDYGPSSLLDMVQGFSAPVPVEVQWESEEDSEVPTTSPPKDPDGVIKLDIVDIEQYWRCPRQYYYARVLGLREAEQRLGYKRFHDCVYRIAEWMRDLHLQSALPQQWMEIEGQLEQEWARDGPVDHVHEKTYLEAAHQMLRQLWQSLRRADPVGEPWARESVVELDRCQIRVRIDHAEAMRDGSLYMVRYRTGKERRKDRSQPRLALYREAARQSNPGLDCRIELQYLSSGTVVEVSDQGSQEKKHLEEVALAARCIAAGDFPPRPDNRSHCARCTFFIICPGPAH